MFCKDLLLTFLLCKQNPKRESCSLKEIYEHSFERQLTSLSSSHDAAAAASSTDALACDCVCNFGIPNMLSSVNGEFDSRKTQLRF